MDKIIVRGAREHNLKNITIEIPRDKFVVLTGLSGSGKSTLAFDTIYAEGQRRYVESLSSYARQFIGLMNKPDIDSIEGLSPAISIEQKTTSKNPRSTVGTVTEIYDYLRLLFARIGIIYCPKCGLELKPQTQEIIAKQIMEDVDQKIIILAPIVRGMKGFHEKIFEDLQKDGFVRVRIDGNIYRLDEVEKKVKLERYEKHWIEAVVDNLEISEENRLRISDGIEQALKKGNGTMIILDPKEEQKQKEESKEISRGIGERIYSTFGACQNHPEIVFEELEPRMFSFNSPFGACQTCLGLGQRVEVSPDLLIPNKNKSIMDGALTVYGKMDLKWRAQQISAVGKKYGFDLFTPIKDFTNEQLEVLLYGTTQPLVAKWKDGSDMHMENGWEGVINQTMRLYTQTESNYMKEKYEKLMISIPCSTCKGKRLKEKILAVRICEKSIIDVTDLSVERALEFFNSLEFRLGEKEKIISKQILKEIKERLGFLNNVGLGYLTISRSARTLSGGEAQRIRLATQIGANLMGVLYILDEPSIGLHQKDNKKLIDTLHRLRDLGNTLIVVEHDEDTIKGADHIIDIGPGAGVMGGEICAEGTLEDIIKSKNSLTGKYLRGEIRIEVPKKRKVPASFIELFGATENNLKSLDVSFPTGVLCAITGVSGSGKSTLMNETLVNALKKKFGYSISKEGKYSKISIPKECNDIIVIDQEPIGRTPRSNPATYTKLFDDMRKIFANTKEAKERGYSSGRFSFNTVGGRCEECKGDGVIKIEMNFLPDVYVECEECRGKRYNRETLEILYKGKTIADILNMAVCDALGLFQNYSSIKRKLQTLNDVGLGYIKLGQSATTLSGGESQRIKLTRELAKFKKPGTVYLLDEPTTGLHFEDVRKLLIVLNKLVEKGNTVYIIEHNLDVIKSCDYVIDLGPEGGEKGGLVIAQGSPEDIVNTKESYTGEFLKKVLK
ncbi:MAG: excinuclease ABC subunit UvrA [Candidatus Micrarchaeia archaeon]